MLSDYSELLSILNAHRVKYLVIGAYAVAIHAQPRATKDLDILVKADPGNAKAVFAALAEFGAPLHGPHGRGGLKMLLTRKPNLRATFISREDLRAGKRAVSHQAF